MIPVSWIERHTHVKGTNELVLFFVSISYSVPAKFQVVENEKLCVMVIFLLFVK